MSARDELESIIERFGLYNTGAYGPLIAFRDRYHPELPDGAIELAPGWHLRPSPDNAGLWMLAGPDGGCQLLSVPGYFRSVGQPVPEPTPEITVGCIVTATEGYNDYEYRGEVDGHAILRDRNGKYHACSDHVTTTVRYVAASWDEVPA